MRPFYYKPVRAIAIVLFITPLFLISCEQEDEEEESTTIERREIRPEIIFTTADGRPLQEFITSQGIVEAQTEHVISTRVSGYVEQTIIEDGRYVQAGDTLLAFREDEFLLDMKAAENGLERARYEYEVDYLTREQAQQGQTAAENNLLRIYSGYADAELAYDRAMQEYENIAIIAPFSGYLSVTERAVPGTYMSSGTEIGRLLDDRTVLVRFDVLEAEVNLLDVGMPVIVTTPTGIQLEGSVRWVSPVVDPDSKTGQVRAEIRNADRLLKTGMTVGGRINIRTYTGGTRIPRSAVQERDGGRLLTFKLDGRDNHVEWVYIEPEELIAMTPDYVMVNNELAPGDTLAVEGGFTLSHLQPVTPRMEGSIFEEQVPAE